MPTYYQDVLSTRPDEAVLAFAIPPLLNLLVKVFINSRLEAWLRSSYNLSTLSCRRVFSVVGFTGSAVALLIVPLVSGANAATVCFGTALSFVSLHPSGFKANYLDAVSASNSGFISGVGNTLASGASFAGPIVVGHLLERYHNWSLVFGLVALTNLFAAAVFATLSTGSPVDVEAPPDPSPLDMESSGQLNQAKEPREHIPSGPSSDSVMTKKIS
uniref:Major facilitator superfamily (MFS) profile domain-containing protein n=1 Tax=Haptolina ericina TaxID=156174 RepID=A0A7S3BMG8_9EUKA